MRRTLLLLASEGLLLLGVGFGFGFGFVYLQWQSHCADLLQRERFDHQVSLQALHESVEHTLVVADSTQRNRREDDVVNRYATTRMLQCLDQQSKRGTSGASSSSTLDETASSPSEVVVEPRKEHDEVLQRELENATKQDIETLKERNEELLRELENAAWQAKESTLEAERQLESLRSQLQMRSQFLNQQRVQEMAQSNDDADDCEKRSARDLEEQIVRLHASILWRRETAGCRPAGMDTNGRFVVEFALDMPGPTESHSISHFEVEFMYLHDMPHTIWTFLNLVQLGLYTGTTLGYTIDEYPAITGGGSETSTDELTEIKFQRQYTESGYPLPYQGGGGALLFDEVSSHFPCSQFTFGFLGKGPDFVIPLVKRKYHESQGSCPGRIIRGRDTLLRLQHLETTTSSTKAADNNNSNRARVVHARLLDNK
jgi:cyclophilin family peptidyl-prolyl cis-trans isomerase